MKLNWTKLKTSFAMWDNKSICDYKMAEMVEENCDKEEICKIIDQKDENEAEQLSEKKKKTIDEKIEYEGWEKWERDDIVQEALKFFAEVQKESVKEKTDAFKKFLAIVKQYCEIKKNHSKNITLCEKKR